MSIVVLVGPSGSGKDTIGAGLAKAGIPELVSFTTRDMRIGEEHGVDYYYVDEKDLENLNIVETDEYAGNSYGLLAEEVDKSLEKNENVYFVANVDGAKEIKKLYKDEVVVFWLKTDIKTMRSRMVRRGDSESNITKRIMYAVENNELKEPDIEGLHVLNANKEPDKLIKEVLYTLKRRDISGRRG